jgi:hypothetical protein
MKYLHDQLNRNVTRQHLSTDLCLRCDFVLNMKDNPKKESLRELFYSIEHNDYQSVSDHMQRRCSFLQMQ